MAKLIEYKTLKKRVAKAISKGNHETRYIIECVKCDLQYRDFCRAIVELQIEGVICYNESLNGYYLRTKQH